MRISRPCPAKTHPSATNSSTTFVSHSSLSREQRQEAEEAFATARNCVIVATSTLELGIDVGDLDRVIQIDAPTTVASFLQRIGRTGRRPGSTRNCLFLASNERSLLQAAALLKLWESGFVEPIESPACPYHIFAQQLLALSLQHNGIGLREWEDVLLRLPAFADIPAVTRRRILDHLQSEGFLFSDGARWCCGDQTETRFGRRHFLELVSVFTTPPVFTVMHGQKTVGTVDPMFLGQHTSDRPLTLALAGKGWRIHWIDWREKTVFVELVESTGRAGWFGLSAGLPPALCDAIRELVLSEEESPLWTTRAKSGMRTLRESFDHLRHTTTGVCQNPDTNFLSWFNFSGAQINQCLKLALEPLTLVEWQADDFGLHARQSIQPTELQEALHQLTSSPDWIAQIPVPEPLVDGLKFAECLPRDLALDLLRTRLLATAKQPDLLAPAQK